MAIRAVDGAKSSWRWGAFCVAVVCSAGCGSPPDGANTGSEPARSSGSEESDASNRGTTAAREASRAARDGGTSSVGLTGVSDAEREANAEADHRVWSRRDSGYDSTECALDPVVAGAPCETDRCVVSRRLGAAADLVLDCVGDVEERHAVLLAMRFGPTGRAQRLEARATGPEFECIVVSMRDICVPRPPRGELQVRYPIPFRETSP